MVLGLARIPYQNSAFPAVYESDLLTMHNKSGISANWRVFLQRTPGSIPVLAQNTGSQSRELRFPGEPQWGLLDHVVNVLIPSGEEVPGGT